MIVPNLDHFASTYERIVPFIVFEGVDGAGKTTLLTKLKRELESLGATTLSTREPGGATSVGASIRSLLLDPEREAIHPLTELLLYSADRAEHVTSVVRPALERGEMVLCDRYYYSTLAFQGHGRGLDLRTISTLSAIATTQLEPSLVILLDLDPAVALERARSRGKALDVIERQGLEFHTRIRQGFLSIAEESSTPFLILDGRASPDELCASALPYVEKLYRQAQQKQLEMQP